MDSMEKWLGNWLSAQLFGLLTWREFYDSDGYPKDIPEWALIREIEVRNLIESFEMNKI